MPIVVRSGSSSPQKQKVDVRSDVSRPVLIAAVVLALLLVVGLAYHYLGPQSPGGTGHVRALNADEQWERQKAQETKGDFNKLSQEDQRRMISIDGAKAPFDLRQMARSLKIEP